MTRYYFFGLLFSLNLWAQCESVDLNKNTVLKDIPITDQDGSGLCYAYSSAQLIEFQLRYEGYKGPLPSPLGMSLVPGTNPGLLWDSEKEDIHGGFEEEIIESVKANGFMGRECIELAVKETISRSGLTSSELAAILHHFFKDSHFWTIDSEVIGASIKKVAESPSKKVCSLASNELLDILKLGNSVTSILKEILAPCYKTFHKVKLPEFRLKDTGADKEIIGELNMTLNSRKPAAISVCSQIFNKKAKQTKLLGLSPPFKRGANGNLLENSCSPHAVLAVGKKMINGECNYLIRNSWGAQWNGQGKLRCACKSKTTYYDDCDDINKIKSNIKFLEEDIDKVYLGCWVSEKDMATNLLSVGGFK